MTSFDFTDANRLARLAGVFLILMSAAALVACTASEEVQRGGPGEYCNDDDEDCRDGLTCQDFVCVDTNGPIDLAHCDEICDRLDECERPLENCAVRCENTTEGWGESAIDSFKQCFTEDFTCDELQDLDDPPQECYDRVPLSDTRLARCNDFIDAARDCGAERDRIDEFDRACRAFARTRGDDDWDDTDECVDAVGDGVCADIYSCLNSTFDPEPRLQ